MVTKTFDYATEREDGTVEVRFHKCGCTLQFRAGDPPVRAWECEHGNCIRAVDPPNPNDVLAYQRSFLAAP
jgi:hypothetical protein